MNVITFTGNLGKDAEQKYTANKDSIVSFSVALKSGYGDKATTTWLRCSMFGKRGESVLPYLTKGQLVGISGEFSTREWQDKEGQTRTSCEVRVNDLTLLGKAQAAAPKREVELICAADIQPRNRKPKAEEFDDSAIPF